MKILLFLLSMALTIPVSAQSTTGAIPLVVGLKASAAGDRILARAYKKKFSGFMVKFRGTVVSKLQDDNEGSRHQRFIVKLASGQTLLIAHNLDLAPRVGKLRIGKKVVIYGEYIWNDQGGIIHKTHLDPGGDDPDGWIRYRDTTYQ